MPEVKYTESPGHFEEWVRAIQGGPPAMSNFADYSAGLTETMLLGNLAVWVADKGKGQRVEWDAKNMRSTNVAGLEPIIKPTYRAGYTLDVPCRMRGGVPSRGDADGASECSPHTPCADRNGRHTE